MTNKTRLDSLQVGERFKLFEGTSVVTYIHMGVNAEGGQNVRMPSGVLVPMEGSRYVIPLDPPPAIAEELVVMPETHKNVPPRCPLCGLLLDAEVSITDVENGTAVFTITPKSLKHVAKPHTLTLGPEEA